MNRDLLIKKLSYRSNYRGCKETDLLLGQFSKNYLTKLTNKQLEEYDYLLDQPDLEIYNSFINPALAPDNLKQLSIWDLLISS
jgi:succinate dehydrogenase flavin-adding protein (antitoxin of CptAB toxin-antitoxin module)